eukprot:m.982772 g.982772  ORF g.982772 m.982772 type:complete len:259 (+) comp23973_c0_seq25:437-1213(+)
MPFSRVYFADATTGDTITATASSLAGADDVAPWGLTVRQYRSSAAQPQGASQSLQQGPAPKTLLVLELSHRPGTHFACTPDAPLVECMSGFDALLDLLSPRYYRLAKSFRIEGHSVTSGDFEIKSGDIVAAQQGGLRGTLAYVTYFPCHMGLSTSAAALVDELMSHVSPQAIAVDTLPRVTARTHAAETKYPSVSSAAGASVRDVTTPTYIDTNVKTPDPLIAALGASHTQSSATEPTDNTIEALRQVIAVLEHKNLL